MLGNTNDALWTMRNGYALCTDAGLASITATLAAMSGTEREAGTRIDTNVTTSIRSDMALRSKRKTVSAREPRVPRTYRLPLSKVKAAKLALGAATATDTIEQALALVVFQRHLIDGTRSMLGVVIAAPDDDRRVHEGLEV